MTSKCISRYQRMLAAEIEANARSLASIESVPESNRDNDDFRRGAALLPHCALARRVWLWRIAGEKYENPTDWFPAMSAHATRELLAQADNDWRSFLDSLDDATLARTIEYSASDGTRYASTVDDIIMHVFNHSTYHRGQIARIVHELSGKRASTDYIAMTRTKVS
jgi:uncharacterized damage-inducible protein DinB